MAARTNRCPRKTPRPRPGGFTLIEILVVVVILGILAAIVIPQFGDASEDSMRNTFATNGKLFVEAAQRFYLDNGVWPEDAASGALPTGMEAYVQRTRWENGTPIGGVWDSELDSFGIVSAIGVHFDGNGATRDDAFMAVIDAAIDDGDIATGGFRKIAGDRYYFIIAE